MTYNLWGWTLYAGYTVCDLGYCLLIGGSLAGLELMLITYIIYKIKERGMIFSGFRIKRLQEKTVERCDLREQIEAVIEEKREVIEELEKFLFDMQGLSIKHSDLRRACGNIQKEIQDDRFTNYKLHLLFCRTYNQRLESWKAKRVIAGQLRDYLKSKGVIF